MAGWTGLEPHFRLKAKSLKNADLVDGQFVENGDKMQGDAVK
jgi:hypothetical protein